MSSDQSRPLRVGHMGAAAIVEGNTLESFDAALAAGVDMIEFDVVSERPDGGGRLVLAHDRRDTFARRVVTLERALEHLGSGVFADVQLDVDIKVPGYARRVVEVLRSAGMIERTLMSGMFPDDLDLIRTIEPGLRLGWSVPRVRHDYTSNMLTAIPALALLSGYRALLPSRAAGALRSGRFDAIMAHWRVVTPALVRAVKSSGGQLYVWTVDDRRSIARLTAMGVDGIISNDPRLFAL